ncbi:MAG: S8 family serine peptidase [Actinomycetota bacterium]
MSTLAAAAVAGALAVPGLIAPAAGEETSPRPLYLIPFSSGTVDPARAFVEGDPKDRDLVLVQFERFGEPGMVQLVAASGVRIVQPLAPVSYIVWADAAQTQRIRRLDGVRWAGVLPSYARVSETVTSATTTLRVTVVGDPSDLGMQLLSDRPRPFTSVTGRVVEVAGGPTEAVEVASVPQVYSVADGSGTPALRDELSSQVVAQGTPKSGVEPGYQEYLKSIKADGSGVVISHVDGGVDFNHPDLQGRVEACISYSSVDTCATNNHDDVIGHGTHTLGIILGTAASGLGDIEGFRYGQGMAPGAKAVVQNAIGLMSEYDFDGGFRPLYRDAQLEGAIVSGNSWGPAGTPQGYDEDTREFDTIVRDANSKKRGHQEMALVFSIMNGGGGKSTQGSPDEGKNIIGVGGTGNRGLGAPGHDDLCTCTAHGPALDGRLLPTLVAPGQQVISSRAAQGTLCGIPFFGWSPLTPALETPPSPLHAGCTGTSMASPHVTGGYAVFTDWYRRRFKRTPSPALVKAAFVNGAEDLVGAQDADGEKMSHIPNNQQGWGRFNLGNVMDSWIRGAAHIDQSIVFTRSGQSHSVVVKPIDPSKPIRATLAWTDAPGPGLGEKTPAWINDLDLLVRSGKRTWLGNVFAKGWSKLGGRPDRMNNVENVYVRSAGRTPYRITVDAANIIGNGLPARAGMTDQDFALVVTNARILRG